MYGWAYDEYRCKTGDVQDNFDVDGNPCGNDCRTHPHKNTDVDPLICDRKKWRKISY